MAVPKKLLKKLKTLKEKLEDIELRVKELEEYVMNTEQKVEPVLYYADQLTKWLSRVDFKVDDLKWKIEGRRAYSYKYNVHKKDKKTN